MSHIINDSLKLLRLGLLKFIISHSKLFRTNDVLTLCL